MVDEGFGNRKLPGVRDQFCIKIKLQNHFHFPCRRRVIVLLSLIRNQFSGIAMDGWIVYYTAAHRVPAGAVINFTQRRGGRGH